MRFLPPLLCGVLLVSCGTPPSPSGPSTLPVDITVSAANYATTPLDTIIKHLNRPPNLAPVAPATVRPAAPSYYLFLPGELFDMDVPFSEICVQLVEPLAKKGLLNAGLLRRAGRDPGRTDLILRLSGGIRPWRLPVVRADRLAFKDGLVASAGLAGMASAGGESAWDYRAGGDDGFLHALEMQLHEQAAARAGPDNPPPPPSGLAFDLIGGQPTRDFCLVVIDAFGFDDLKQHGLNAQRVWTTFVAVPRQPGQPFSAALKRMIRIAGPYLGETTDGLHVYDDNRAKVIIGETTVAPDASPPTRPPPAEGR